MRVARVEREAVAERGSQKLSSSRAIPVVMQTRGLGPMLSGVGQIHHGARGRGVQHRRGRVSSVHPNLAIALNSRTPDELHHAP
eukprot:scaffold36795_cov63-Phaeocystis_antarctica.AAC.2